MGVPPGFCSICGMPSCFRNHGEARGVNWFHRLLVWLGIESDGEIYCLDCGCELSLAEEDVEIDFEANQVIGDWRCGNGHVQRIIANITVVDDE